jgi:alkane 1-monooxygenase
VKYLRYYLTPLLTLVVTLGLYLGGAWMWLGLCVALVLLVGGDAVMGDDHSNPTYKYPLLLQLPMFFALPILSFMLFMLARSAEGAFELSAYLGGVLSTGLLVAGYGTNVAHELTHRIDNKLFLFIGRWILSMSGNADFSIEHVFGHHKYVATRLDPASARRGENVYSFALRSTIMGHVSAWKIELARLKKKSHATISIHNQMLTGYAMSITWVLLFYSLGGLFGVGLFVAQAAFAKFILEVVNYLEHYGLERRATEAVKPHHSWNSNKRVSMAILYSLVRHSAHHERASVKFWKLDAYPKAPELPFGYLTTILICLVPPLWYTVMDKRIDALKI